jgi:hypothetical protein
MLTRYLEGSLFATADSLFATTPAHGARDRLALYSHPDGHE